MPTNKYFQIGLWGSAVVLLIFSNTTVWAINQFSIACLERRVAPNAASSTLPIPPEKHTRARVWLAEDALDMANTEEAITFLQPQTNSKNDLAMRTSGAIFAEQGNFDAAIEFWLQIGDYQSLIQLADQVNEDGKNQVALKAYDAASAVSFRHGALPLATFLSSKLENPNEAIKVLEQAIQMYPSSKYKIIWLQKLGNLLQETDQLDKAANIYQQALVGDASDYQIYIDLGNVYYKRGDGLDIALQEFEKAIKLNDQLGDGYFAAGQILVLDENFHEADFWFSKAIERNPEIKWWRLERANSVLTAGNLDYALHLYKETATLFPDWAPVHFEMAKAYKQNGHQQGAVDAIATALELINPPNIWYYLRAGQIFEWAGDTKEAIIAYRNVLQIDPNNETALNALLRLESQDHDNVENNFKAP